MRLRKRARGGVGAWSVELCKDGVGKAVCRTPKAEYIVPHHRAAVLPAAGAQEQETHSWFVLWGKQWLASWAESLKCGCDSGLRCYAVRRHPLPRAVWRRDKGQEAS